MVQHGIVQPLTFLFSCVCFWFLVYRSVSLVNMRDKEDVDSLSSDSHEMLQNQYNKVQEENDEWRDVCHIFLWYKRLA